MEILPQLSLPAFSETKFNYNQMTLPKKHIREKNQTILGRITDIYLNACSKKNVNVKHFVKCNYLEELVEQDKMNYIIAAFYPTDDLFTDVVYYAKCHNGKRRLDINEEDALLVKNSINYEEIPTQFLTLNQIYKLGILYNYHVILEAQMFSTSDERKDPLFSTFVLLKPTCKLVTGFNIRQNWENSIEEMTFNDDDGEAVNVPLYLDTGQSALKLAHSYENPFESSPEYMYVEETGLPKQKMHTEIWSEREESEKLLYQKNQPNEVEEIEVDEKHEESIPLLEVFENPSRIKRFLHMDMKEKLREKLESRKIYFKSFFKNCDCQTTACCQLVEIFIFEHRLRIKKGIYKLQKDEILVYTENDEFYVSVRKCDSVIDVNEMTDLYHVSTRKNLDAFILLFATTVSEKFTKGIHITHKRYEDDENESLFFFCMDKVYDCEDSISDSPSKDVLSHNHEEKQLQTTQIGKPITPELQKHSNKLEREETSDFEQNSSTDTGPKTESWFQRRSFTAEDLWTYDIFLPNKHGISEEKDEEMNGTAELTF